jgi:Ni,Fe-hydrogenase maturation factor
VKDALFALEFAGRAPREVTLIGVVPATTEMGLELSPAVKAAVPSVIGLLLGTLTAAGFSVTRRLGPTPCRTARRLP